jgi:hypothetical protein
VPSAKSTHHRDDFFEYFQSLAILSEIQSRIPLISYAIKRQGRVPRRLITALETSLRSLGERLSFDKSKYASLVNQYWAKLLSTPSRELNWRDLKKEQLRKTEPDPLRDFILQHNKKIHRRLGRVASGSGKSRSALSAILESSFLDSDSRYEAQVLLKDEVSKEEVQSVITAWKKDQQSFEQSMSGSPLRTPEDLLAKFTSSFCRRRNRTLHLQNHI